MRSLPPELRKPGATIAKARDGLRVGDPIPGSRYVRGVCCLCGEPIRVGTPGKADKCHECDGDPIPPRPPVRLKSEYEYHGRMPVSS